MRDISGSGAMWITLVEAFGCMCCGDHGTLRVDDQDDVGLLHQRLRHLVAEVHLVARRQIVGVGVLLHDGQHGLRRQRGQRVEAGRRQAGRRGDDQRELRACDQLCGLSMLSLRRGSRRHADGEALHRPARADAGIGQRLARQRQVDRPARLAHRDVERAVDDGVDRLAGAQLIVPLHELAHHRALVEALLAPVDLAVARGDVAGLGQRRAAGGEQDRHVVARRIHQAADRVRGADRDVAHHGRDLAGGAVVAVGHRHRQVLVRHGDEARVLRRCRTGRDSASMIGAKSVPALANTYSTPRRASWDR